MQNISISHWRDVSNLTKEENIICFWFTDFLGVGYFPSTDGIQVLVVFKNSSDAAKVWKEHIAPLNEKSIKLSFVEKNSGYKFMLYSLPLQPLPKTNFGLYRSLDISEHYLGFKNKCKGEALLRFAVLGNDPSPTLMDGSKQVAVKFMNFKDVTENSPENMAEEAQNRAREDAKKDNQYIR
jgi:hypothetical protein